MFSGLWTWEFSEHGSPGAFDIPAAVKAGLGLK
jgi:hypothetical protein